MAAVAPSTPLSAQKHPKTGIAFLSHATAADTGTYRRAFDRAAAARDAMTKSPNMTLVMTGRSFPVDKAAASPVP